MSNLPIGKYGTPVPLDLGTKDSLNQSSHALTPAALPPRRDERFAMLPLRRSGLGGEAGFATRRQAVAPKLDDSTLAAAREVYRANVMYHGTNEVSKINIAQNGFKLANKVGGHTQDAINKGRFGADSELAEANSQHHHFAANKSVANVVAMTSSPGEEALVRLIGVANEMRLEPDPFMRTANGVRTNADVPSEFVLGSKHSPPRANGEVFRRALSRAGIDIDQDRAGQLLRAVQSDSEDDFRAESDSEDEFELPPLPAESNSNVNRDFRFGQGPESHGDAD